MKPSVFVLTGGPGAGKTESRDFLKKRLEKEGYSLIFVPESATELITAGITDQSLGSSFLYQQMQLDLQLEKEKLFNRAAEKLKDQPAVVVFDRGALDGKAYSDNEVFEQVLESRNLSEKDLLNRYDAVFFLETAAKSDPDYYTISNNAARTATPQEAIVQDNELQEIWKDHPDLHIIPAQKSREKKMELLTDAMLKTLHDRNQTVRNAEHNR